MFDNKLKKALLETLKTISDNVSINEIGTQTGRKKLDALFGHDKPYYIAVVNPLRLTIHYFCPQSCKYLGFPDLDYQKANFGLLLKVLAKENMGMVYTEVQHFISKDKFKLLELNCKVKRYDNTWRDVYFISKLLDEGDDSKGFITVSVVIDVQEYLDKEFKRQTDHINNNFQLSQKKLLKINELTPREKEVLVLYCNEKSITEISENLNVSEHTVRAHKRAISKKLNTKSTFTMAKFALYLIANPHLMNGGKVDF